MFKDADIAWSCVEKLIGRDRVCNRVRSRLCLSLGLVLAVYMLRRVSSNIRVLTFAPRMANISFLRAYGAMSKLVTIYVGTHLFLSIGDIVEITVEVRGEPLSPRLFCIPLAHAHVPGAILSYHNTDTGTYSPDGILVARRGERVWRGLLFFV